MNDPLSVLVVEDQPLMQRACQRLLSLAGYKTILAASLAEARQRLADGGIDLVLLDLKLPDGHGFELLDFIGRQRPAVGAVVVSGYASSDTILQAGKLGAVKFLSKPFEGSELVAALQEVAAGRQKPPLLPKADRDAVVAYIRRHFRTLHNRRQVADHFGLSAETVSRHVRQATGRTFKVFLHDCKIAQARKLLGETNLPIKAIADLSGYRTPQQLARAFRERAECSPHEYRAKKRGGNVAF